MKAFERIFLYSVLAILVFYVFLVDNKVESQVAIQEEIRARRIVIVNDARQEVVKLWANKDGGIVSFFNKTGTYVAGMGAAELGGLVSVRNNDSTFVAGVSTAENGGGFISVRNKDSTPAVGIGSNRAGIVLFNRAGTIGVVEISATEDDDGMVGVSNKAGSPGTIMGIYKEDGLIAVYNKHGDVIGSLP
jgi:hypothetical protein